MPLTLLDIDGLTLHADKDTYLSLLDDVSYDYSIRSEDRLSMLARLRYGAGVTIITGPRSVGFWSLVSPECHIVTIPDAGRGMLCTDEEQWSLLAVGCSERVGRDLVGRTITKRHSQYAAWVDAQSLLKQFRALNETPLIVDQDDVSIITVTEAETVFENALQSDTLLALDWEWSETTQQPYGLSIYTEEEQTPRVYWVSVLDTDTGLALKEAVSGYLRRGGRCVWHFARADIGTQHPSDPIDLHGTAYRAEDTSLLAYLVGESSLGLKPLTKKYLNREPVEYPGDLSQYPEVLRARYAAGDTRNTFDLYNVLQKKLDPETSRVYETLERPLVPLIASMERGGIPLDMGAVHEERRQLYDHEQEIRWAVFAEEGLDLAADIEVREYIKRATGYDPGTCDQRTLASIPDKRINTVLDYRRTRTRRRNFLDRYITGHDKAGNPTEYRLYPRYNQAGSYAGDRSAPRTGRLSSAGPNIQQQPRSLRRIFIPPPGHYFFAADYSQLELRVAAALSGDAGFMAGTQAGQDIHEDLRQTVVDITGLNPGRVPAKTWNFGKLYGASLDTLLRQLALERVFMARDAAEALDKLFEERHQTYIRWAMNEGNRGLSRGYGRTLQGRRCYPRQLDTNDPESVQHARRFFVNAAVQGTAAYIVKQAMLDAIPVVGMYKGHISGQVHDELFGWVPIEQAEPFVKHLQDTMVNCFQLPNNVPLIVNAKFGAHWGECK